MTAYYNENEPYAAAWLRNLIVAGHLPPGDVDERDVRDVRPADLDGYDQCHFFAGIGGWPLALRMAGWPDDRPVWTSTLCSMTWREQATPAGRPLFRLAVSVLRTSGQGCGLWPTPDAGMAARGSGQHPERINLERTFTINDAVRVSLWPTPKASDSSRDPGQAARWVPGNRQRSNLKDALRYRQEEEARLWPTPAHRDYRFPNAKSYAERGGGLKGEQLPNSVGGPLNPAWVAWLMGYPEEWDACAPSAMPLSPRSRKNSFSPISKPKSSKRISDYF